MHSLAQSGSDFEDHAKTIGARAERRGAENRPGRGYIESPRRLKSIGTLGEIMEYGLVSGWIQFVHNSRVKIFATVCCHTIQISSSIPSQWAGRYVAVRWRAFERVDGGDNVMCVHFEKRAATLRKTPRRRKIAAVCSRTVQDSAGSESESSARVAAVHVEAGIEIVDYCFMTRPIDLENSARRHSARQTPWCTIQISRGIHHKATPWSRSIQSAFECVEHDFVSCGIEFENDAASDKKSSTGTGSVATGHSHAIKIAAAVPYQIPVWISAIGAASEHMQYAFVTGTGYLEDDSPKVICGATILCRSVNVP